MSDSRGRDAANEFLSTLGHVDQARFNRFLLALEEGQRVKSPQHMRHLNVTDEQGAEVHELKTHSNGGLRLYVVRYGARWYCTHGGKKVHERRVPREARKALAIFWDEEKEEENGAVSS